MKLDVSTRYGYDIACALRGPDQVAWLPLKNLLTSRIRFFAGAGWTVRRGATLSKRDVDTTVACLRDIAVDRESLYILDHYMRHAHDALYHLGREKWPDIEVLHHFCDEVHHWLCQEPLGDPERLVRDTLKELVESQEGRL